MNFFILICIFFGILQTSVNFKLHKREAEDLQSVTVMQRDIGYTEISLVEFGYEWIIKNASKWINFNFPSDSQRYLKSPKFSMETSNKAYVWSLCFFCGSDYYGKFVEVQLILESDINYEIVTEFDVYLNNLRHFKKIGYFGNTNKIFGDDFGSKSKRLSQEDELLLFSKNDELKILLNIKSIIPTMISDTYNLHEVLGPKSHISGLIKSDPDHKIIQQLLHVIYTGRASSYTNVKNLLWAGDNIGLKAALEEKLFSKMDVTNAAEIYEFMFVHNKPELKKKAMEFIKQNVPEVMGTPGWISVLNSDNTPLLAEIFSAFVNKPTKSNPPELDNEDPGTPEIYIKNLNLKY